MQQTSHLEEATGGANIYKYILHIHIYYICIYVCMYIYYIFIIFFIIFSTNWFTLEETLDVDLCNKKLKRIMVCILAGKDQPVSSTKLQWRGANFWWGGNKNLVVGIYWGGFSRWWDERIFGWWEGLPQFPANTENPVIYFFVI